MTTRPTARTAALAALVCALAATAHAAPPLSADETAHVGDLVPELKPSAFGDATVRQVMDMTTALDYSEDYADPDAEVWKFAAAGSLLPGPREQREPAGLPRLPHHRGAGQGARGGVRL